VNIDDSEKEIHFKNALSNYSGVLQILAEWEEKVKHDINAPVPENWEQDPFLLFGEYLEVLKLTEQEKIEFGKTQLELIQRYGVEEFWGNRRRYAAEIEFIRNF
jgi:hypothetical protein